MMGGLIHAYKNTDNTGEKNAPMNIFVMDEQGSQQDIRPLKLHTEFNANKIITEHSSSFD